MDVSSLFIQFVEQARAASPSARVVSVSAVVLWSYVFISAVRKRQHYAVALSVATVFCLVSENVAIQLGKYHYGVFPLALPSVQIRPVFDHLATWGVLPRLVECPGSFPMRVPLEIAMLEGTLLYAVFRITNLVSPPRDWGGLNVRLMAAWFGAQAPNALLNGFLAVSLDSILDPIASGTITCDGSGSNFTGIALWTWHTTSYYGGHWFGVPLANYTAWFAALMAFTLGVRVLKEGTAINGTVIQRGRHAAWAMLRGVGALALLLFVIKLPIDYVMYDAFGLLSTPTPVWWQFTVSGLFVVAGVYGSWNLFRRPKQTYPVEWSTLAPVIFVFAYMLVGLFRDGLYRRSLWLVALWVVAAAIATLHASGPFRPRRRSDAPKAPDRAPAGV
jgi:hypothetical protein